MHHRPQSYSPHAAKLTAMTERSQASMRVADDTDNPAFALRH